MENTKIKLLKILEILLETDEQNPITAGEIIKKLKACGIAAQEKAIYRDVQAIKDAGYDIDAVNSTKKGYYMVEHEFEDWEIKVLLDAVHSAQFLTESNRENLSNKLIRQVGPTSKDMLRNMISISSKVKGTNTTTKYNIDKLLHAIKMKNKVSFQYTYVGIDENKKVVHKLRKGGFRYVVNPYALIWQEDRYYLICNYDKYDGLSYYRLDKIINLEVVTEKIESKDKFGKKVEIEKPVDIKPIIDILGHNADLKMQEYVDKSIYRYQGETISLILKVDKKILERVVDYFGENIDLKQQGNHFEMRVRVMESEGLYYWLLQHGENVSVVAPESVKEKLVEKVKGILNRYDE